MKAAERKGMVSQIQDFSVHDGPGIRSTIFLSGCPLRCSWCANPETWEKQPPLAIERERCMGCGQCFQACPVKGSDLIFPYRSAPCQQCNQCIQACPSGARKRMGREMTVKEVVDQVMTNQVFFRRSGGGVTFSGGEATSQLRFLEGLIDAFEHLGIEMALETCGYFQWEPLISSLERLSLIFFDLKHMDSRRHRHYTGMGNELILENLKRLGDRHPTVIVRIPLVKGVNDDVTNLIETAAFVKQYAPGASLEVLPYHAYGLYKYEALGLGPCQQSFEAPSIEDLEQAREVLGRAGVQVII